MTSTDKPSPLNPSGFPTLAQAESVSTPTPLSGVTGPLSGPTPPKPAPKASTPLSGVTGPLSGPKKLPLRDANGRFVKKISSPESGSAGTKTSPTKKALATLTPEQKSSSDPAPFPPLFSFSIANPVTYLKIWWSRLMYREGIDVRFRIKPVTAFGMALFLAIGGFGLGRISLPPTNPIVKYIPTLAPSPTPNPLRDTAYSGTLHLSPLSTHQFFLVTNQAEAVALQAPTNVNLDKYIGKRILAAGVFDTRTNILTVTKAADMELLPNGPTPIPTVKQDIPTNTPSTTSPLIIPPQ